MMILPRGTSYSKQEIIFVKRNWQKFTDKELSQSMQRTWRSVSSLRAKLGLIKPKSGEHPGSMSRDLERGVEIRKLIKFIDITNCPILKQIAKDRILVLHEIIEKKY